MTDYAATDVSSNVTTAVPERSGTAAADTIPAGSRVLWRNSGAGAHVVTLTTNNQEDSLAVADRTISLAAGEAKSGPVPRKWGDVNGRVAVAIDGTAAEVKYYVMSGT